MVMVKCGPSNWVCVGGGCRSGDSSKVTICLGNVKEWVVLLKGEENPQEVEDKTHARLV